MYTPRINAYFSGAGLMDLGLTRAGCEIQQSFEIDKACVETQRANFAHRVVQSDLTKKLVFDEDYADVYSATYPCTKYSNAADINGTRTGDDLYLHFLRHVALKRPEAFVLENVPGMRKFPVVMEAMTRLPDYYVQVFCPVDSSLWLPQHRKRLIIFGSKRFFLWREPEALSRVKLDSIVKPNPSMPIPDYVLKRLNGAYRDRPIISDPRNGDIAPTCVAHYSKDLGTRMVVDRSHHLGVRPYTVKEYAGLQGVPETFVFKGSTCEAYKMIGNGVSIPVAEWCGRELVRYFN